ncbi:M20 family metallopeptidase [Nakamurella sp. PAMC28650]|uniref:M20 family metallopeptidase n=1 Tax=Nakamurella sp. PAMC28650 TaxID=2762325 RepID=UPI00164DE407|nr:M20 family metallopeptidase [Nakamurella sp. PAMC28650]QNK79978.1 M20 family metallopeptidase [Nakamurella sp. PAMC28650]
MTDLFDGAAVIALTQALVRLPTVVIAGIDEVETPACALIAATMRDYGWEVTIEEVATGRPNVVGIVHGRHPARTLMFEGHVDVVTPGDVESWSFPPFSGDVVDGRLLGRGSADMKSGVAAMIHAARAVELAGFDGRIIVGVLADEEGMMLGAKHFAASPLAASGIDGVIVCEPEGGEICAVAKGAIRLRVDLQGVMAHGAMPHQGRNPLPAMGSLLMGLSELERQVADSVGIHRHLGEFYLTPTVLAAGDPGQLNVIPASASVFLDVRTIPGVGHAGLLHLITRLAEQIAQDAGLSAAVTVIDDRPPVDTPEDAPVVAALVAAHSAVTGTPAVLGGVPGTTDGTILTRDAGLQTVVYGPGGKWIAHTRDEFVEVQDILTCTRVFIAAAQSFLGVGTDTAAAPPATSPVRPAPALPADAGESAG